MPRDPFDGPIVVDANVLFSALIRDGTTRHIILHPGLDLHTPEYLWEELQRNQAFLIRKSGAPEPLFNLLVESLKQRIRSIPLELIQPQMAEATRRVGTTSLDAPYVAAALAINGAIWTHDKPLSKKSGVAMLRTKDLVQRLG